MKKLYTLIILAAASVTSYANAPTTKDTLSLRNTTTHFTRSPIDIALSYPQLFIAEQTKDSTKKVGTIINSDVCRLMASLAPSTDAMRADSLWMRAITPEHVELYTINAAKELLKEIAGYGSPSAYDFYSEWTAFSNDHLVSIFIKAYMFTGGAHGMTIGRTLNYDVNNGRSVDLEAQIKDTAFLMDLAALYFCKERHLPKNAIKLNTGLFYELSDLPMPDQIGFTSKGMMLYWDPYSIAPYSYGPIAINIPYKELDDVLAENFYKMKVRSGGSKSYNQKRRMRDKE